MPSDPAPVPPRCWQDRRRLAVPAGGVTEPGYVVRVLYTIRYLLALTRRATADGTAGPAPPGRSGHSIQRPRVAHSSRRPNGRRIRSCGYLVRGNRVISAFWFTSGQIICILGT